MDSLKDYAARAIVRDIWCSFAFRYEKYENLWNFIERYVISTDQLIDIFVQIHYPYLPKNLRELLMTHSELFGEFLQATCIILLTIRLINYRVRALNTGSRLHQFTDRMFAW